MTLSSISYFRNSLSSSDHNRIMFIYIIFFRTGHIQLIWGLLDVPLLLWMTTELYCAFPCRAATDHNVDNTTAILREWLKNVQKAYHYVEWRPLDEPE